MQQYYLGGGPMVTPQGQRIAKMKRDDPEAYKEYMRPARRWWAKVLTVMAVIDVVWVVICMTWHG